MTKVPVPEEFTSPIATNSLYDDNIGYVELYDFSRANLSEESRIACISTVASVCYQSPKALGSISLYNRLAAESAGLPSSSFEFVPVLINITNTRADLTFLGTRSACIKYGEFINESGDKYLLTNLRALLADVGDNANQLFNTEEECAIIAKHFKVFKTKIPLFIARQFMRHRCSWQELSRRYVSSTKSELEFYWPAKLKGVHLTANGTSLEDNLYGTRYDIHDLESIAVKAYNDIIVSGIKPELARTVLPQSMYTTVWSAWQPSQLDVLYKLRIDKHAQAEIQELAAGMKSLSN